MLMRYFEEIYIGQTKEFGSYKISEKEIVNDLKACNADNFCLECLPNKPNRAHHCEICNRSLYYF